MVIDFNCAMPAKTFVLGEYSVTQDGRAIILLSEPCFEANFYADDDGGPRSLSPRSLSLRGVSPPIAKFINLHPKELANKRCDFIDPYKGIGGFGASSAEFLAWIKYYYFLCGIEFDLANPQHYQQALEYFVACSSGGSGTAPSGADMIAQNSNRLAFVNLPEKGLKTIAWPFADLVLCLAHTKNKVATYLHLARLKPGFEFTLLSENVAKFNNAVDSNSEDGVIQSINSSCAELDRLGFLHPRSGAVINSALKHDFCLAAKGCGAMGSDVILFVFRPAMLEQAKSFINAEGLDLIYYFLG
tara:strand:- start:4498 stop:5400 length:903 start_codon:yes stop_codon:yes gene_type:complete